jgi:Hypothetical chloroplast protein Ycf34
MEAALCLTGELNVYITGIMCICVNCHYVDRCVTYNAVEHQHGQPHLTETPDFEAIEPTINVNIRSSTDEIEMEWDVVGCESFQEEVGKWAKLRPGELIPT